MADILKITTPLVNKNPIQHTKQLTDPTIPFNLEDISRVVRPNAQNEFSEQNTGMLLKNEAPSILADLLKDPAVTVNFLKNIFMIEEIIRLIPANNCAYTQEMQKLFDSLLINPDEIALEMQRQENSSTAFKGELFDFLRGFIANCDTPETRFAVANLLKAINDILVKRDILDSISNSLQFLSEKLDLSKALLDRMIDIAAEFFKNDAGIKFASLKNDVTAALEEIQSGISLNPKTSKVLQLIVYNLSRFSDNPDFLHESVAKLLKLLADDGEKATLLTLIKDYVTAIHEPTQKAEGSKVMRALSDILSKQTQDSEGTLLTSEKVEKIISSLLSSPCNFTPLLHFIVPSRFMGLKSFAEIWIDPNNSKDEKAQNSDFPENIHALIVFDIEEVGRFEAEVFVCGQVINFFLFCPKYFDEFSGIESGISEIISDSQYKAGEVKIFKLERLRSLMDVFKDLPHKRRGVDVKA